MRARRSILVIGSAIGPRIGFAVIGISCALFPAPAGAAPANPMVCGNQDALGNFDTTKCPHLTDIKGNGIYTVSVQIVATDLLKYKILPSGAFDGTEEGQIGACGPTSQAQDSYPDMLVPRPDVSKMTLFSYDTRDLSADRSYAPAVTGYQPFGDTIMMYAPGDARPQWTVVSDAQPAPLDMAETGPGIFSAQVVTTTDLPARWKWKVQEKKSGQGSRQYRPAGWSYTDCRIAAPPPDDDVVYPDAVPAGQMVRFVFYSGTGRLQTLISPAGDMAGWDFTGGPPDLTPPRDLGVPTDLSFFPGRDLPAPVGMEAQGPQAGCHCHMTGPHGAASAPLPLICWIFGGVLGLLRLRRRR